MFVQQSGHETIAHCASLTRPLSGDYLMRGWGLGRRL